MLTGGSSPYYQLPKNAKEIQDLIEAREMNFAVGNMFKATWRLGRKEDTSAIYDLDKIIWFAEREKRRILRQEDVQVEEIQGNAHGSP